MKNIIVTPEIQSGTPVFANTRVPIKNLFDYIKGGDSLNDFLEDFPSVKINQAQEVLDLASSHLFIILNSNDKNIIG
jgi:uncharacterized protein (DUF433 family)